MWKIGLEKKGGVMGTLFATQSTPPSPTLRLLQIVICIMYDCLDRENNHPLTILYTHKQSGPSQYYIHEDCEMCKFYMWRPASGGARVKFYPSSLSVKSCPGTFLETLLWHYHQTLQ